MQAQNELERLQAQKKEIEDKIRALKNQTLVFGRVRMECRHYTTAKPDTYFISVRAQATQHSHGSPRSIQRWNPLFHTSDKPSIADELTEIINDLTKLRDQLKGEGNGADS